MSNQLEYIRIQSGTMGFPGGAVVKNLPANARDTGGAGRIPGSGRSPGVGNVSPLQCSCLQNPRDGGAPVGCRLWGRTESDTTERLSSGRYKEGFPQWLSSTESACEAGDKGSIPGSGRSPGVGNVSLLQYSCLENPLDRGAWWATAHKSRKGSDTTERLSTHAQGMCTTDVR